MAINLENIFTIKTSSAWDFLIGQGCYIPAYQRPYAWDKKNISRLFEDVLHGIRRIEYRRDTISFLGTIIATDTNIQTVKPIYRSEFLRGVMTIIDGQQRICTAVMSNIVLHDYIRREVARFNTKTEPHFQWIKEECAKLLDDIRKTYMIDQTSGDSNYRYYPRVIRAHSDAWSKRQGQAEYKSPVAKLIWEYIDFTESKEGSQFKFCPKDSSGNMIDHYKMICNAFSFIQYEVRRICQLSPDQCNFPDLVVATRESAFSEEIWGFLLLEEVKKYVKEESEDTLYDRYCYLLRLIIFSYYLNHRVAMTVVTATNEDDAFDVFESLNTTGELLTAFETFRPKVIAVETLPKYEHSPSYTSIKKIEEYLDLYNRAASKQRATADMVVSFALAETGDKRQKDLSDQRLYLREEFDKLSKLSDIEENRAFVRSFADVASFMRYGWDVGKGTSPSFKPLNIDDEEALVGFEVLRGLKHSITIAPLSRFYQYALDTTQDLERQKRTEEFIDAIKATVAFSILWRSAKGRTENIDSHYRAIMGGVNIAGEAIPPLARRPKGKSGVLSLANYKRALQLILEHRGAIQNKDEWVKRVSRMGIYEYSVVLTRFLLFCASDNAVPDEDEKGLIKRGRPERNPMLKCDQWGNDAYFTVEHIAPQSQRDGWEQDIFDEPETVHTLGNLILLPREENNIIGNRSWEHKQLMYRLLASETEEEFNNIKEKLSPVGLELSNEATDVLDSAKYLGICKSVSLFDKPWSLGIIKKRTERFAELAWDRLEPWLFP